MARRKHGPGARPNSRADRGHHHDSEKLLPRLAGIEECRADYRTRAGADGEPEQRIPLTVRGFAVFDARYVGSRYRYLIVANSQGDRVTRGMR